MSNWRDCERSGIQEALDRQSHTLGRQLTWTRAGRSVLGIAGVLCATWTTQLRVNSCLPSAVCFAGADEIARLIIVLVFFVGTLLEFYCLLARPEGRYAEALTRAASLRTLTWTWIMDFQPGAAAGEPVDEVVRRGVALEALNDYKQRYLEQVDSLLGGAAPIGAVDPDCLYLSAEAQRVVVLPYQQRVETYSRRLYDVQELLLRSARRSGRSRDRLMACMVLLFLAGSMFASVSMLHRDLDTGLLGVMSTFLTGRAATLAARDRAVPEKLNDAAILMTRPRHRIECGDLTGDDAGGIVRNVETVIATGTSLYWHRGPAELLASLSRSRPVANSPRSRRGLAEEPAGIGRPGGPDQCVGTDLIDAP